MQYAASIMNNHPLSAVAKMLAYGDATLESLKTSSLTGSSFPSELGESMQSLNKDPKISNDKARQC
jgi:hypothetical protein